ncbi:DnaD domain protein [Carnobacterium viridans]|uniref:DnaD and phage-associated domain-containing protein n=1 Tax=Carnobacterium viridans TaxID=174587 RepID=A0A1H0YWC3_9LACT|nr:DnaD domain protein [Carnobacterium viridans]UDE94914.1 DnaD domain protein [Carnobacterium viridans]SDQ19408.1 DnaD and phage-associated domain-containing protein [Carnobacterium viridans]
MEDKIKIEGVLSLGYGIIPKLVMKDKDLTIEAKAIYAYISSYAGNGTSAFPSVSLICNDLDIGENRFHKHKKVLVEKGYIEVKRERTSKGSWGSNVYTINSVINYQPTLQNDVMDEPTRQNPCMDNPTLDSPCMDNDGTNNNSFNNNSSINNSLKNKQQQPASEKQPNFITTWEQTGFGMIPPLTIEKLEHWVKDFEGNESIVVKAIEVASDQGVRKYAYVNTILKNWEDKGVKSVEDIDALEKKREAEVQAKKAAPRNNFNKAPLRKETLPDWAKEENQKVEEKPMSAEDKAAFNERLARIQNRRAEA